MSRFSSSLLVHLLTSTYLLLILQSCLTQLLEPLKIWDFLHKQSIMSPTNKECHFIILNQYTYDFPFKFIYYNILFRCWYLMYVDLIKRAKNILFFSILLRCLFEIDEIFLHKFLKISSLLNCIFEQIP